MVLNIFEGLKSFCCLHLNLLPALILYHFHKLSFFSCLNDCVLIIIIIIIILLTKITQLEEKSLTCSPFFRKLLQ